MVLLLFFSVLEPTAESGNTVLTPVDGKIIEILGGMSINGTCDMNGKLTLDGLDKDVVASIADLNLRLDELCNVVSWMYFCISPPAIPFLYDASDHG